MDKIRKRLMKGDRSHSPCNKCSVDGSLFGKPSFDLIKEYYGKSNNGKSKLFGAIISRLHDTIVYKKLEIESCRVEAEIPWKHFDIFINNASVGFSQTDLLNEAFSEWRHDKNKLIINITNSQGDQILVRDIYIDMVFQQSPCR